MSKEKFERLIWDLFGTAPCYVCLKEDRALEKVTFLVQCVSFDTLQTLSKATTPFISVFWDSCNGSLAIEIRHIILED